MADSGLLVDSMESVLVLGGIYLGLYLISHGAWVGDGDWLLGTAIGLALMSPWLSLVTLFLTNLIACIYAYGVRFLLSPSTKIAKIHLGPFMVAAFIVVFTFSDVILELLIV